MSDEFKQSPVSETAWPWMRPAGPAPADAGRARRRRTLIQFAVALMAAGILYFGLEFRRMAWVVLGVAGFLLISGLWIAPLFNAVERFLARFARWIGLGLTWLLLVPFFFLVFVPARVLLALRGKDPMRRRFPSNETTAWITRPPKRNAESYRRQY